MDRIMEFKKLVAQYCDVKPEDMTDSMDFREDLGLSSLDFMSFLGELEDTFDVELELENAVQVRTIGEALEMLDSLEVA
ncbi:MAG: acyl carrier protein [Eubacterium sp.]|nr:acyl carrier protein [Eubacterium sp.]SEF93661.1 acyl carrier protein [Eubacterium ruminantium]